MFAPKELSGYLGLPLAARRSAAHTEICLTGEMTAGNPDRTYEDYMRNSCKEIQNAMSGVLLVSPVPQGKYFFDNSSGSFKAVDFPGITVISPTFECKDILDEQTMATFKRLALIQTELLEMFGSRKIYASDGKTPAIRTVPENTFHTTIASMLYSYRYRDYICGRPEQERFLARLGLLLPIAAMQVHRSPLSFYVPCISIVASGIVARLVPGSRYDYEGLIGLRKTLYDDQELQSLGVFKSADYLGHVTLAYFSKENDISKQLASITGIVNEINRGHFYPDRNLTLNISCADVRFFPNMDSYDPLIFRVRI